MRVKKRASPFKGTNPNMRSMTYSGMKLLAYLRQLGHVVYPFDKYQDNVARPYEVYPSYLWRNLGLKRNIDIREFIRRFNLNFNLKIDMQLKEGQIDSLDASDAVVACASLGQVIYEFQIDSKNSWDKKLCWINEQEWENRLLEGLIVR